MLTDKGGWSFGATPAGTVPVLEATGLGKRFGGVQALVGASFSLAAGRVLGIVGENGAGKSTLMKVLAGIYPHGAYEGSFSIDGEPAALSSVQHARRSGVVLIPQELHSAPELSIAENMFAGSLPGRGMLVDRERLHADARRWLAVFDLDVDPSAPASELSPAEQKLALIAGALSHDARIAIFDEPTASMSDSEAATLFSHIRRLSAEGVAILYISHRLDDLDQVCDDILVMRNGEPVAAYRDRDWSRASIVSSMIGRELPSFDGHVRAVAQAETALEVRNLTASRPQESRRVVDDVSLTVKKGEIVGLFGLVGAGRTELLQCVFGVWRGAMAGDIEVSGRRFRPASPGAAIAAGIGLLTEDRKQTGIFAGHSLLANVAAAMLPKLSKLGFVDEALALSHARSLFQQMDVRADSTGQPIETLSGGNQQKVLLGRWLGTGPAVLLLDEPTVGVDVGARADIYLEIERLAEQGCAVLVVSSDLDEVQRVSDRILVMFKGRVTAELPRGADRHQLMSAATGGN